MKTYILWVIIVTSHGVTNEKFDFSMSAEDCMTNAERTREMFKPKTAFAPNGISVYAECLVKIAEEKKAEEKK